MTVTDVRDVREIISFDDCQSIPEVALQVIRKSVQSLEARLSALVEEAFPERRILNAWGFVNESDVWVKLQEKKTNQFVFEFSHGFIGRLFMEFPDPLDTQKQFLCTLFAEQAERTLHHVHLTGEIRQLREALKTSENKYRNLVESSPEPIVIHCGGKIVYANPAAVRVSGAAHSRELLGKNVFEFIHPDSYETAKARIERILRKQKACPLIEEKFMRVDGKVIDVEVVSIPVQFDNQPAVQVIFRDISDRKRAEEALRRSEERYRDMVENIHDIYYVVDSKGTIIYASPNMYARTGYRRDEVIGRSATRFVAKEDRRRVVDHYLERTKDGTVDTALEFRARLKDGISTWVEQTTRIIRDKHGNALQYRNVVREITERKQAELLQTTVYKIAEAAHTAETLEELYRSIHELIRVLMPANNFYIALYDELTHTVTFPYLVDERLKGAPPPMNVGRGLTGYVIRTGKSLLSTPAIVKELVARGEAQEVGTPSVSWLGIPLKIANRVIGVLTVQSYTEGIYYSERERNILEFVSSQVAMAIERKRAIEELRESEEKYRTLFEESQDTIYISSLAGKFLDINPAGLRLFGYDSKAELLEKDITKEIYRDPKDRERWIAKLREQGYVRDFECRIKRKDGGERIVLDTATAVRDGNGNIVGFRGILKDVTEQKKLQQQLFQSQKLSSIGTLAAGIAHNFNNLLNVIIGYASVIDRKPERRAEYIQTILDAAERGASLVRQFLAFARETHLKLEPTQINTIVGEIEKIIRETFPREIDIKVSMDEELPSTVIDSAQIQQVLMNLTLNARDAMPKGGSLVITTGVVRGETLQSKLADIVCKTYVYVEVKDTGIGMDEGTIQRIFDPFFTTKDQGTGLGLSMVFGILKDHNGYIDVQSSPGIGSTFRFYLPAAEESVDGENLVAKVERDVKEMIASQ